MSDSTRRHLPLASLGTSVAPRGYGYQWWHNCYRTGHGTFESRTAVGNGQQRIYVLPGLRLAVTMLAGRYDDRTAARLAGTLLVDHIIPSAALGDVMPEPPGCGGSAAAREH